MCFSASASFAVAGFTASIGVLTLAKARSPAEVPFALFPLLFAAQQTIEGLLWLVLPDAPDGALVSGLTLAFIGIAEIVWPLLAPLGVLLIERDPRRLWPLRFMVVLGALTSFYLLHAIIREPHIATVFGNSIRYASEYAYVANGRVFYVACTGLPFLISSHRMVQIMGCAILLGYAISSHLYSDTLISVWCFFAAVASGLAYFHFRQPHARRATQISG